MVIYKERFFWHLALIIFLLYLFSPLDVFSNNIPTPTTNTGISSLVGKSEMEAWPVLMVGAILLIMLCIKDLKDKRFINKSQPASIFFLILFCLINLLIYIILCSFFQKKAPMDLIFKNMYYSSSDLLSIIFISLMYFGTGAATIKVGKIEFGFYKKVLDIFQSLVSSPSTDKNEIRDKIKDASLDQLLISVKDLREMSSGRNWDPLESNWKRINADLLTKQLKELISIRDELRPDPKTIEILREQIGQKKEELTNRLIGELNNYIYDFVITNGRTKEDAKNIFKILRVPSATEIKLQKPNTLFRGLILYFLFGMGILGPGYAYILGEDPISYSWYFAVVLGIFGFGVSFAMRPKDIMIVLLLGALSGLTAHLAWIFITGIPKYGELIKGDWKQLLIGMEMGAGVTGLLFVSRHTSNKIKKMNQLLRYPLIGLSGAIVFTAISFVNLYKRIADPNICFVCAFIGFVVLTISAISTDIW